MARAFLSAWCVGTAARPEGVLKVECVFERAAYLRLPRDGMLIVSSGGVRSPATVNVDPGRNLKPLFSADDELLADGRRFSGGSVEIALEGEAYVGETPVLAPSVDTPRLLMAASLLQALAVEGSLADPRGRFFEEYRRAMAGFVRSAGDPEGTVRVLLSQLGKGQGFTPSFDDFAAGFLYAHNGLSGALGRGKLLLDPAEIFRRTTWVSGSLLSLAQEGKVDEEVGRLGRSLLSGSPDLLLALQDVAARGHSSGVDMAVGMLLATAATPGAALAVARRLGYDLSHSPQTRLSSELTSPTDAPSLTQERT